MNKLNLIFTSLLLVLLSACASIPMADPAQDAMAKEFKPVADKSVIYVYRNEFLGAAMAFDVKVDFQLAGKTRSNNFLRFELPPGEHTVASTSENHAEVKFKSEAGKIYYFWQEAKVGVWSPRTAIHQVDEARGKSGVLECKLVKSSLP